MSSSPAIPPQTRALAVPRPVSAPPPADARQPTPPGRASPFHPAPLNAPADGPDAHAPAGPPAIRIQSFSSYYGPLQALQDITMQIREKRITAFIGPSGCGKSTLLRWINRMNDMIPSARAEGSIHMHDVDVLARQTDAVDLRRRVGIVFQKPNPFPKSIFDNVAFGTRLHLRLTRKETAEVVEWALRRAALWDEVKDRLANSALGLSGGQQQRLCIARAIAVGPQVLLMDEPCSALDPRSTAAIEQLMLDLRETYTIVIVTHNMQQASRVSDDTAFLYSGQLIEFGPTDRMFQNPQRQETSDYITGRFG